MSAATENSLHALSAAEADQLINRLERDRPRLEERTGLVQPVDRRAFSDAEVAWMQRDLLMMARLLLEQQQADELAEARKEEVRRKIEARRIAAGLGTVGEPSPSANAQSAGFSRRSRDGSIAPATTEVVREEAVSPEGTVAGKASATRSPTPNSAGQKGDRTRLAAAAALAAQQDRGE